VTQQSHSNLTWHHGAIARPDREKLLHQKGVTLWMTGLSGSGKSTIACLVESKLLELNHLAYRLDGDNIRHGLNQNLGFTPEDRTENIRRIAEVAKLFTDAGLIVLASFISPYAKDRAATRALHSPGDFLEIYIKTSLATAEQRDPKGLYKKARAGAIKNFTGIDDPYEEPTNSDLIIDTEKLTPEASASTIVNYLKSHNYFLM
jgi:adenylylsulfate kinase